MEDHQREKGEEVGNPQMGQVEVEEAEEEEEVHHLLCQVQMGQEEVGNPCCAVGWTAA